MMKITTLALTLVTLIGVFSAPAFAREIKTIVGYVETTTIAGERDAVFKTIDESGDGAINFKEFQKAAMLVNEYEMFNMNDTNGDDLLSMDEYRNFSKQGPAHGNQSNSSSNFNFNKKPE